MRTIHLSIMLIVLIFSCSICQADPLVPWKGSGTIVSPYEITTADELLAINSDPEFLNDQYILKNDIDLSGYVFTGSVIEGTFIGIFDGNGHVIRNITIIPDHNIDNIGIFSILSDFGSGGILKDLGIVNLDINTSTFTAGSIGGLVARIEGGSADSCFVTGSITTPTGTVNVGGLTGLNGAIISSCYTDVNITGGYYTGGLSGDHYGMLFFSYSSGSVSGAVTGGGLIGKKGGFFAQIFSCYYLIPGAPVNGHGTPLTDELMHDYTKFVGWDFLGETINGTNETWTMDGYPVFAWQSPVGTLELGLLSRFWMHDNCTGEADCSVADWYIDGIIDSKDLLHLIDRWMELKMEPYLPQLKDDFETGDFTVLDWQFSGNENWYIDTDSANAYEGSFSARSGGISDSQSSSLELTLDTTGYDFVVFNYKVSSEEGFDNFKFYVDGSGRIEYSGDSSWLEAFFPVYNGQHSYKWVYHKDSGSADGSDCVWIDNVRFIKVDE